MVPFLPLKHVSSCDHLQQLLGMGQGHPELNKVFGLCSKKGMQLGSESVSRAPVPERTEGQDSPGVMQGLPSGAVEIRVYQSVRFPSSSPGLNPRPGEPAGPSSTLACLTGAHVSAGPPDR